MTEMQRIHSSGTGNRSRGILFDGDYQGALSEMILAGSPVETDHWAVVNGGIDKVRRTVRRSFKAVLDALLQQEHILARVRDGDGEIADDKVDRFGRIVAAF